MSVHGPVAPYRFDRNCSGAPYWGENAWNPLDVLVDICVALSPSCMALAIPKSSILTRTPFFVRAMKMFAGLTSRCAMRSSWARASASITGRSRSVASRSVNAGRRFLRRAAMMRSSSSPSSHSSTR
jgi:hypothetical protein